MRLRRTWRALGSQCGSARVTSASAAAAPGRLERRRSPSSFAGRFSGNRSCNYSSWSFCDDDTTGPLLETGPRRDWNCRCCRRSDRLPASRNRSVEGATSSGKLQDASRSWWRSFSRTEWAICDGAGAYDTATSGIREAQSEEACLHQAIKGGEIRQGHVTDTEGATWLRFAGWCVSTGRHTSSLADETSTAW